MIDAYQRLARRIRDECSSLEQALSRAEQAWRKAAVESADQYAYVDSVALNLASFYTGVETLFELVARHVDGKSPSGPDWHRDLLQRMTLDLEGIRMPVISAETAEQLDELRRFRHIVRHIYADHLAPGNMRPLVEGTTKLWARLSAELHELATFLDGVSDADDIVPR